MVALTTVADLKITDELLITLAPLRGLDSSLVLADTAGQYVQIGLEWRLTNR
jgi:hypothetical protein